ncbi:hypothetical protein ACHAXT_008157 [Thalassiosira profunda]
MKSIDAIVQNHAVAAYTVMCFLFSWGSVVLAVGLRIPPPDQAEELLPILVAGTLLGPSVSGVALSLAKYGVDGTWKNLRERYRWENRYALASLFAPAMAGLALCLMGAIVSSELYAPAIFTVDRDERASLVAVGVGYGVVAGSFEELGWSLFAVPEMLKSKSVLQTGLEVGLVWGVWHFLVAIYGSGDEDGALSFDLFLPWIPWNLLVLPVYRVLMVWVFEVTGRRVLPMALLHGTLTASLPLILMPKRATGAALAYFYLLFAFLLATVPLFCLAVFRFNVKRNKIN